MLSIAAAASYKRNRETNKYFRVNCKWLLLRTILFDIDSIFMLYISELITFTEIKKCI